MSRLGEALLRTLVRKQKKLWQSNPTAQSWDSYIQWQHDSSGRLLSLFPGLDFTGKSVLEIGCGTGGRSAYLACAGAARVVGIDINAEEIGIAREACPRLFPKTEGVLEFLVSTEQSLLPIGTFDVVLLVDAMEHVVSPPAMMRLAHHYTAPGGRFYFGTQGWYHHRGSHTGLLPFVNVFFSDETIVNVIRWRVSQPDYQKSRFDSDPPVERWRGLYDLRDRPGEHLNKITIGEIKKLVRYSIFAETKLSIIGFSRPPIIAPIVNAMRLVPWLQEVFHSYVVVMCRK